MTLLILITCVILNGLLLAYCAVNASRAWQTMKDVTPGAVLNYKRKTYTEKELAKIDYANYRTMFTLSLVPLICSAITAGLLLFVFLQIYTP